MANLVETQDWVDGVYQIETTDRVLGGADGTANKQAKSLASRTAYLKKRVDTDLAGDGGAGMLGIGGGRKQADKNAEGITAADYPFLAVGDGVTDNTTALNAFADYCRANGVLFRLPAGIFYTGKVDITGLDVSGESTARTILKGKAGEDVLYWKGGGEPSPIRIFNNQIKELSIVVDDTVDVRSSFVRVSMDGQRIGNCGIFLGGGSTTNIAVYLTIDNVKITGGSTKNGACALFMSEPINGLELPRFQCNSISYGIIEGISNKYANNKFIAQEIAYDTSTNTFTKASHGFANNTVVTLIYDKIVGSFDTLAPRVKYYVVSATSDTFQLSLTSGGAVIDFAVASGAPAVCVVRAGASGIEYAPDVRSFGTVICKGTEASMVLANGAYGRLGKIEMQSSRIAFRFLNFPSLAAYDGNGATAEVLYVEGPLDNTWGAGHEYWTMEWSNCNFARGMAVRGFIGSNSTATISGSYNKLPNIFLSSGRTLYLTGGNNEFDLNAPSKEANLVDTGVANKVRFMAGASGDATYFAEYIPRRMNRLPLGGWSPDYLKYGPSTPFDGEGRLLHVMYQAKLQSPPAGIEYKFDDASLDVNGYLRYNQGVAGGLTVRNPWSISNTFAADSWFPRSKFRIYFKLRATTGTPSVTIAANRISGTGTFSPSAVVTLSTSWAIYSLDVDASVLSSDATIQIYVNGTYFDFAYFYIMPWSEQTLSSRINYGGGVIDAVGDGSPEGVLTAGVGSTYRRRDGGASTTFYVKQSGTGNTGWVAK